MDTLRAKETIRTCIGIGGMVCAIVIFYINVGNNPFQYDDIHSIVENPHVRFLTNLPAFFIDPTLFSADPKSAMYRPLVLSSYAVNYAISEYRAGSYHGFNLLVHLGTCALVFALVRTLGGNRRQALWGGLLFGLHPINSETVNYISSRSESLCALFFLLSLLCYAKGSSPPNKSGGAPSRLMSVNTNSYSESIPSHLTWWPTRIRNEVDIRWLAGSLAAFAGALLSKEVGITLIGVLLVYEVLYRGKQSRGDLLGVARRQWPFWGLGGLYLLFARPLVGKALVGQPVRGMGAQLLTQAKGLVYYLKLLAVPVGLNVEHPFKLADGLGEVAVLLSLGLLVSAVWMALGGRMEGGQKLFWLVWPVVVLLPTLVVPLNVLVNEHRLYLPSVALAVLGGWFLGERAGRHGKVLAVAGGILLLVNGSLAYQRTGIWQSRERLWGDALAKAPLMPRPHIYMGDHYKEQGKHQQALEEYQKALTIYPQVLTGGDQLIVFNNMGATYLAMGRFVAAIEAYQRALLIDSTYVRARESLAGLLALQHTEKDPAAEKLRKQGLNLMIAGRLEEAIASLKRSLELQNDPQTWMGLAVVYERKEDWQGALRTYEILRQVGKGEQYARTAEERIRLLRERR